MTPPEEGFFAVQLPIDARDLKELELIVKRSGIIVRGNYEFDNADDRLLDYITANTLNDAQFRAVFDRNLLSPLVNLAAGDALTGNPESDANARNAAACAAFCILGDILIEPAMALYEYASATGNSEAQRDLSLFRVADNVAPSAYVDIALGRCSKISAMHLAEVKEKLSATETPPREPDFQRTLSLWSPNYLHVLKAYELRRSAPSALEAAKGLLRWEAEESFYNAAASLYCLAAISHRPPKGQMLKSILSANSGQISKGIRNATWDVCLIRQFAKHMQKSKDFSWSLWSSDLALRQITRSLFISTESSKDEALSLFFLTHWGKRDGRLLLQTYLDHMQVAGMNSTERAKVLDTRFSDINSQILLQEKKLGIFSAHREEM